MQNNPEAARITELPRHSICAPPPTHILIFRVTQTQELLSISAHINNQTITMSHIHADGTSHSHSHDHGVSAAEHGHSHEILDGPGSFLGREMPIIEGRDWKERAFTVGIGG